EAAPPPPAPSSSTFSWLGTTRAPNALHRFCTASPVRRVAGMHLNSTLGTQVICREGPMTDGDTRPSARPALSPLLMAMVVSRLWAGIPMSRIFQALGMPIGPRARLGYGTGTSAGGVLQISG